MKTLREYIDLIDRAQNLHEGAQDDSERHHGWRARLIDEINPTMFEVEVSNSRSGEKANFVVRPVDMMRMGSSAAKLQIDTMDLKDLQTGLARSVQSDSEAPWVYILDAVSALFWDTPALQQRLETQLKSYQTRELSKLPGVDQRRSAGQALPADKFLAAKDAMDFDGKTKNIHEQATASLPNKDINQVTDASQQRILNQLGKRFGLPPGSTMAQVQAAQQAYLTKTDPKAAAQYQQNMANIDSGKTAQNKPVQLVPRAPDQDFQAALAAQKSGANPTEIMLAQPNIANNPKTLNAIAQSLGLPAGSTLDQVKKAAAARRMPAVRENIEELPWHGITDPDLLQDLIADAQVMDYDEFHDTHSRMFDDPYEFWDNYHDQEIDEAATPDAIRRIEELIKYK